MLTYRHATPHDAESLLRTRYNTVVHNTSGIYPDAILQSWAPVITPNRITQESQSLQDSDRTTIVAEEDNVIVGLCTLSIAEGLLQQCYVLPPYNGKGVARELVKQIETVAKDRGLLSLKLSSSLIALGFYKKQGYVELNRYDYDLGNGLQMVCVMMEKTF